jgi:hypothetical protein
MANYDYGRDRVAGAPVRWSGLAAKELTVTSEHFARRQGNSTSQQTLTLGLVYGFSSSL